MIDLSKISTTKLQLAIQGQVTFLSKKEIDSTEYCQILFTAKRMSEDYNLPYVYCKLSLLYVHRLMSL